MTRRQKLTILAIGFLIGWLIAARGHPETEKGRGTRAGMSRLEDVLLTDGAQASLCARWIEQLAPDLDKDLAYRISLSVARWSRNYGVDPKTMICLIAWETRGDKFNPNARGAAGEHGLCQIYRWPAAWGDWRDVDTNIMHGCAHFAGNLRASGGDEFSALIRYNGTRSYARQVLKIKGELQCSSRR